MSGPGAILVRKEISGLTPSDPIVTGYAGTVRRMRERAPDDPTSWTYQAAIHGTTTTPARNLWNQCQHATWYFLPWHRMFLYYFERIVRATVVETGGPTDWTLPYWNYCLGDQHAFLPEPFRAPASGAPDSLYVEERDPQLNSGEAGLPDYATSPARALERPHFIGKAEFGGPTTGLEHSGETWGRLEVGPHNAVHVFVKGLMGSPETAALDPIFWLHHANIDRLWSEWIGLPGASHANPPDEAWRRFSFSFFDEHGQDVALRCEDVLETAAQLGYTYDTEPIPSPPARVVPPTVTVTAMKPTQREMIGATPDGVTLTGQQTTVPVPIASQAAEGFGDEVHAYLNVEEIEGEHNPGVSYLVYADLEGGEPPHPESPHYLGTLSFFGVERARAPVGDESPHALQASYDITPIARELEARGEWAGHELPETFAPLALVPPGAGPTRGVAPAPHDDRPIRLGRLSVFYDA
jgi:tyrosinase-like protein/polyphenol oxidase-like protein